MGIDAVLAAFPDARRSGSGWSARCPAHHDNHASLSIGIGDDGRILLKCFAGCSFESILAAAHLTSADCFAERPPASSGPTRLAHSNASRAGLTLDDYAKAKQLPTSFLGQLGLSQSNFHGAPAVRIPYLDEQSVEIASQYRLAMLGSERFRWSKGHKPSLYGLWRLADARSAKAVVLVEGASDAQTLWYHDVPALGIPGASLWRQEWESYLDRIPTIFVVIEPDAGGDTILRRIAKSGFRDRVRLIRLTDAKDPSEFFLLDPPTFAARWAEAVSAASALVEAERDRATAESVADLALAMPLLNDPNLLSRVAEAMRARGFAGSTNVPLLVYLALTSRLLERPQNLAIIAPSAAGKNRAVDAAVQLIPAEGVYLVSAGSARALVYTEESFEHRTVIFAEADSIPEDGPAAAAVRSIAADQCMVYEVVEKSARTGRHETRRIKKQGPTGLVTTSTRSLSMQMGTRVLEVTVRDDPDQTRAVMRAHAARARPGAVAQVPLEPFLALQRWLASAGIRSVALSFADALAELVPCSTVRMRRDFSQLLTTIQTLAFLHQCQRGRTPEGWVEATIIDDYAVARELLSPVFDALAADSVTPATRQTVAAVRPGEMVSETELARRLGLAKSTTSYRVGRAVAGGWLLNDETRRGHPARLTLGAPLPDAVAALPTPEALWKAFECANAIRTMTPPASETGGI